MLRDVPVTAALTIAGIENLRSCDKAELRVAGCDKLKCLRNIFSSYNAGLKFCPEAGSVENVTGCCSVWCCFGVGDRDVSNGLSVQGMQAVDSLVGVSVPEGKTTNGVRECGAVDGKAMINEKMGTFRVCCEKDLERRAVCDLRIQCAG